MIKEEEFKYYDWFEILEEQSDNELALLALDDLKLVAHTQDPNGFLVVSTRGMPKELKQYLAEDSVTPHHPFKHVSKVLLRNDRLSKYLAHAKAFRRFEVRIGDDWNEYVQVLFKRKENTNDLLSKEPFDLNNTNDFFRSARLHSCLESFSRDENNELVQEILDAMEEEDRKRRENAPPIDENEEFTLEMLAILFKSSKETILKAILHTWLKNFDAAKKLMTSIGIIPVLDIACMSVVRHYLELLIIHEKKEHIEAFYSHHLMRKAYLTHYEIYNRLFIDPSYECTRPQQASMVHKRLAQYRELFLQ